MQILAIRFKHQKIPGKTESTFSWPQQAFIGTMGFFQWVYQMHLPHISKVIFCLVLERKDIEAGVLDGPDKGRENKK